MRVAILLSSFNGEDFIKEQLNSLLNQIDVEVDIYIRDDGSTDNTAKIITDYKNPSIKFISGKNIGVCNSFMELLQSVPLDYDYYAFSDQDDVWEDNKLIHAVEILERYEKDKPNLYYSALNRVDKSLKYIDKIIVDVQTSFEFSLVRSVFPGCTMVFNLPTVKIIQNYNPKQQIMHDHFLFQIVSGLNGSIFYDEDSYIKYRIHGNNISVFDSSRVKMLKKRLKDLTLKKNSRLLALQEFNKGYGFFLNDKNREILFRYVSYMNYSWYKRMKLGFSIKDKMKYRFICTFAMFLKIF
ncbi:MAG: glycosyltransferase [Lachnospiraceae bacterium]|nr:glycosyltransferase [Lachnospiraceae bacterium]